MREFNIISAGLLISWLVQCVLNAVYFSNLLVLRRTVKKPMVLFALFQFPVMFFSYLFITDGNIRWIFASVGLTVLFRLTCADSWKKIFISVCGLYLLIFLATYLVIFFFQMFHISAHDMLDGGLEVASNFVFNFFYFIAIFVVVHVKNRKQYDWKSKRIRSVLLFSVVQLFLVQLAAYVVILWIPALNDFTLPNAGVMAGAVLCMTADLLLFQFLLEKAQKEQLAVQLRVKERQSRLELAYYESIHEGIQEIRWLRHDFNNQLQTAYHVLAQGNRKEAQELLCQLEERIEASSPVCYCSNPVINALLWDKGKEARIRGIVFQTDVKLTEQTGVEISDLCSIFSSLLDERIQASSRMKGEQRIFVSAYQKEGVCVIQAEHTGGMENQAENESAENETDSRFLVLQEVIRRYRGSMAREKTREGIQQTVKLKTDVQRST